MRAKEVYDKCPAYASDHFLLRLVEQGDAEDLLRCYSDASAVRLMNADNCTSDFHYQTLDEMKDCIRFWLREYGEGLYVRFSIIDNQDGRAVGTIEMFGKTKNTGILRLDLCSAYERRDCILELLGLSVENFHNAFSVQHILTKAIPVATERIAALRACGFLPAERHAMKPHGDYYVHDKR